MIGDCLKTSLSRVSKHCPVHLQRYSYPEYLKEDCLNDPYHIDSKVDFDCREAFKCTDLYFISLLPLMQTLDLTNPSKLHFDLLSRSPTESMEGDTEHQLCYYVCHSSLHHLKALGLYS